MSLVATSLTSISFIHFIFIKIILLSLKSKGQKDQNLSYRSTTRNRATLFHLISLKGLPTRTTKLVNRGSFYPTSLASLPLRDKRSQAITSTSIHRAHLCLMRGSSWPMGTSLREKCWENCLMAMVSYTETAKCFSVDPSSLESTAGMELSITSTSKLPRLTTN